MKELYTSPELQIVSFAPAHDVASGNEFVAESVTPAETNPGLDLELPNN